MWVRRRISKRESRLTSTRKWIVTVVNTEEDALLLENSLIKKYNPRYNVLLKDGKTYPSICVTNELFPRIFKTRTINKKWGTYYGPYSHVGSMTGVLHLIKELYHPRTCNTSLTKEGVASGRYKVCLDYHIKKCMGPCVGKQSQEDYQKNIQQAREILKGNTRQVLRDLKEEMLKLSEELRFEEAEEVKRKYIMLDSYPTAALIRVLRLNTRRNLTRQMKNCCSWVSSNCDSDSRAMPKRSSYQKQLIWNWRMSPSRSLKEGIRKRC